MNYQIKIKDIRSVEEIENYWTKTDYVQLLDKFGYPDASDADMESLGELLSMAITDFEPRDAAVILLEYKMAEDLNPGQIQQISNDMLLDKICEEYPEIGLHATLFHINQLLFKAYNGKFPNAKATIVNCSITPLEGEVNSVLTKEMVLKLFNNGLSESNIIKRLFDESMSGNGAFSEANDILWNLTVTDAVNYTFYTSENWLKKDDFKASEFEGVFEEIKEVI